MADLLTEITRHLERGRPTPELAAETVAAIAQLNRCIPLLTSPDMDVDHAERHHTLVNACRDFCSGTTSQPGRLRDLAGVSADLVLLTERHLRDNERWAVLVAFNDTLHELTASYRLAANPLDIPAADRVRALEHSIRDLDRAAAAQPPTANDAQILTHAVPSAAHRHNTTSAPAAIIDAAAGLRHYTTPPRQLTLAELLAVTIAADTVCRRADDLTRTNGVSATAWRAVQESLRPFNDGSRRTQAMPSPLVVHALNLHNACAQQFSDDSPMPAKSAALRHALDALAAVADNLRFALNRWGERRTLNAYAVDLNAGYLHPVQQLAGHRSTGIISASPFDLRRAIHAIDRAKDMTMCLSLRVSAVLQTYRFAQLDSAPSAVRTPANFDPSVPADGAPHRHL
jgi:hypothetical protein